MKTMLITGGCGFIGINAADHFINEGYKIILFDNFSRAKIEHNVNWLKKKHGKKFEVIKGDVVYDVKKLNEISERADVILHLAAQVAVTTSITDPLTDINTNVMGTYNVLEAARRSEREPIVIYSSTNKVYGGLEQFKVVEGEKKYEFEDIDGVTENVNLDFHSPYGCSKGAADQYVRDYARVYGLKTVVFRQSCVYGENQYGVEDQGWIAWFIIASLLGKTITVYGNGKQVRDILFVDDLVMAYDKAIKNINKVKGEIFNIGGGKENALSLLEFIEILNKLLGKKIEYAFSDWRQGDQPIFISDNTKIIKSLNWNIKIGYNEGIKRIFNWAKNNFALIKN